MDLTVFFFWAAVFFGLLFAGMVGLIIASAIADLKDEHEHY